MNFVVITLLATAALGQTPAAGAKEHLAKASALLRERHPELAIPELEAALVIEPKNADAQANLGVLLYFARDYGKAIPHFQTALAGNPGLVKVRALLGLAELRQRDRAAAKVDLEAAFPGLKGEKVQREVGESLVEIDTASGELERAAMTVATLLEAEPTDSALLLQAYRLHTDLASNALLSMALVAPQSAELHEAMGLALGRQAEDAAAVVNFREAVQANPKLPGLHREFGDLLYRQTDAALQAEAEGEFRAALALNPNDERAQLMLGEIAAKRGDLEAAFAAESRALALAPNDGEACTELAKVLLAQKEPAKARSLLERAVKIDPTDATAHYRLSTLDRQEDRPEDARHEIAEYQKYKAMKDKLRGVMHDLRAPTDEKPGGGDGDPK